MKFLNPMLFVNFKALLTDLFNTFGSKISTIYELAKTLGNADLMIEISNLKLELSDLKSAYAELQDENTALKKENENLKSNKGGIITARVLR